VAITHRQEILKSLRASPVILTQLVRGLSESEVRWRSGQNEWAIIEVVAHMADTDERALGRLRRMLNEDDPYLPGFDHEALARERRYIEMDLADEVRRYAQGRHNHLRELDTLDASAWTRPGRHEVHGTVTVELYEAHVANEDIDHLAQISRLIGAKAVGSRQPVST
jgi:uncharacterized damage-inducible protein DinB